MLAGIGALFALDGEFVSAERYDGGHINDTYFAVYRTPRGLCRYVHQRINTHVFTDPAALNENVALVTGHIRRKLRDAYTIADADRRALTLVPSLEGAGCVQTEQGEHWRTYRYIERSVSRPSVRTAADAYAAGLAFGGFAAMLCDLPVEKLRETIPRFHDTRARFDALTEAIRTDAAGRASLGRAEISQALLLEPLSQALDDLARRHALALRATHNDAKITNVLFDEESGEALCVVDLDTVMPGLLLYDAGELVRTASTLAAEDEPDPRKVCVDPVLFESVGRGFIAGAGETLATCEREALVTAGKVLAYENGIRFLTDYLNGDRYFRVHRPDQNLDRARAQFAVAASLAQQEDDLQRRLTVAEPAA